MSDNTTLNTGTGGDVIATDDIGSVKYQRVKVTLGADGVSNGDVSAANPMPVSVPADPFGANADAAVAAGAAGSIQAKLRRATQALEDLKTLIVLAGVIPGTAATSLGKAEDAAHTSGDVGVMALGVRSDADAALGQDGDYAPLQFDASGFLKVNIKAGAATSTAGDVAHDAVDSGNPVKIGYNAVAVGTSPAAVAAGDRTNAYANRHGVPFVQPGHPNVVTFRANYTSTQTNAAIVSQAAGGKLVVTRISVAADNANTDSPAVRIGFATATTPTGTGVLFSHPGLPAGFHCPEGNGGGILGIGADDEDIRITAGTISAGSIDVVISYYILPS